MSSPIPNSEINLYQIVVGDKVKVLTDKKSKSRVVNFPFEFPDGENGVLIMCRLQDNEWVPSKTIKSITIEFK